LARHWFRTAVLDFMFIAPEERRSLIRMALDGGAVPRLLDQQLTWFSLIEASGPAIQLDLALRLHAGDGIARNEVAAERLMLKLDAKGYAPGSYHLGLWRLAKARDRRQREDALHDIRMAADRGHLPAMLDLAHRMLEGRDFEPSDFGTYVLFLMIADRGASVAEELALLEERLDFVEIDVAEDWARRNSFPFPKIRN
jgi:TPR repeat protein